MRQRWQSSWVASGWETSHQKDQAMIGSLRFSATTPSFSREGRETGNGVNNGLCLHEEVSKNIPIDG